MALEIRAIPTLTGEVAKRFLDIMEKTERAPKQDFSKERDMFKKIMSQSPTI